MAANKVDRETAELEFLRLCEWRDVDTDEKNMGEKDKKEFHALKKNLMGAIQSGQLVIETSGAPTLHLKKPFTEGEKEYAYFSFHEPHMGDLAAGDKYPEGQHVNKAIAVMTSMCNTSEAAVRRMDYIDGRVAQNLVSLFLA